MNKLFDLMAGSDRVRAILITWLPPVAFFVFATAFFLSPLIGGTWIAGVASDGTSRLGLNASVAVALASTILAALSFILRDDIYRLLEGYSWPRAVREWRRGRVHIPEAAYLTALRHHIRAQCHKVTDLEPYLKVVQERDAARHRRGRPTSKYRWPRRRPLFVARDRGLESTEEELPKYPQDPKYVAATRFGNRMATMESYGYESFGLDSQLFWFELLDVAPGVKACTDDARDRVDSLVALYVFANIYLILGVPAWVWACFHEKALTAAAVSLVIAWIATLISYRLLLRSVDDWGWTIQALVNEGRLDLAKKHGLRLPDSVKKEREMWEALAGVVYYRGDPDFAKRLSRFRVTQNPGPDD